MDIQCLSAERFKLGTGESAVRGLFRVTCQHATKMKFVACRVNDEPPEDREGIELILRGNGSLLRIMRSDCERMH